MLQRCLSVLASAALFSLLAPALAQDAMVPVPPNLKIDGVPPIPAALASKIALYTEFRPKSVATWHPVKRELLVATRAGNTTQLHRLAEPRGQLQQITDFADPVRDGSYEPSRGGYIVYSRDTGGSEAAQIYRLDSDGKSTLLTDPSMLHARGVWNTAGDRFVMTSTQLDKTGRRDEVTTELALMNPAGSGSMQKVASLPGRWTDFRFSKDDTRLLTQRFYSNARKELWEIVIATGETKRLLPVSGESKARYGDANYSHDGKAIILTTNQDGEFDQLARYDRATGAMRPLSSDPHDVDSVAIAKTGGSIATVVNEGGKGVLHLFDANGKPLPASLLRAMPAGMVSGLRWHDNGVDLAFNIASARQVGDVYSLNVSTGAVTRWTETNVGGIDTASFREPDLVTWKSFDDLAISGFIYRPPAKHTGKRPVMINIHGGPEAQSRPGFIGRNMFFVNDLGIAMIYPNVRGSTGFGKTFMSLDDGMKREDSVKDIGALLDWIAKQPDLDASRVIVTGGSYGGYMALAVSVHYADRIAGAVDVVGISNFLSFLERTESYRRDLRRAEYGDERIPEMKAFLERVSPVTNAHKITKPLLVIQGRNDPRVPWQESEQIVNEARQNKTPVWYLIGENEGHGFAKKDNADYAFYASIRFAEETLLSPK